MKSGLKFTGEICCFMMLCLGCAMLVSCAGQRQGLVCEEIEYRYNSMSYSPDQRVFMEEELRACREEEAKKKGSSGQSQKSIYERYASQDSTGTVHTAADSATTVVPSSADTTSTLDSTAVSDSTTSENVTETVADEVPQE